MPSQYVVDASKTRPALAPQTLLALVVLIESQVAAGTQHVAASACTVHGVLAQYAPCTRPFEPKRGAAQNAVSSLGRIEAHGASGRQH